MRFRRAIVAFALGAALPSTALAETGRMVEIGYDITFAGFSGFRIDLAARFNGTGYDVQTRTFKEGLLRALTIRYEGRNRAWGGFTPQGSVPSGGSLSIVVGDKPRTWRAQYDGAGGVAQTHTPDWAPPPHQVIPDNDLRGSLDPLSAGLAAGLAGDSICEKVVPSNDGKRRIDVLLKQVGSETPAAAGVPLARGDLLICEIYTRRIAGEFYDAPKEAETKREQPMKIWFARLDESQIRYPVKLEAQTGFGTIRGRTLFFRERPLTDAEKAEMLR